MIIQFLAQDRSSLLACSLAGSSFYSPSRAHLFAGIEVNSLQRFQGLLELSYASLTTFDHESFKSFSSVRTISVWDVEGWVTPETLPSLLFLPSLAPFPNVKNFRIDNLVLPSYVGAEASSMVSVVPHTGPCIGIEDRLRFGTSRGIATNELFADPRDFLSPNQRPTASLEALSLGNCRVSSLGWFLRYTSCFPDLKSLSLINFTWGSAGGADVDRGPSFQCPQPILQPPRGLSELTLEIEYTPVVACAPSLLFKSLSESLRVLRLGYIDMFISVRQLNLLIFETGRLLLTQALASQISTRVRFNLTQHISPSHHSTFSRTSRSHLSLYGSKQNNCGCWTFYRRSQARPTSRNLTSTFTSPPSRSKPSWIP